MGQKSRSLAVYSNNGDNKIKIVKINKNANARIDFFFIF